MTKISYIAVCAVAALGFSFVSPKAAYAFPAAPGADKTYAQTVSGNEAISVRWGGRGAGEPVALDLGTVSAGAGAYGGWGGYGLRGVGLAPGLRRMGWLWLARRRLARGATAGVGWLWLARRRLAPGLRRMGWCYGWGWPVGLGVGLAAASTYPYYGSGYGAGYYSGYPAYSSGCGW